MAPLDLDYNYDVHDGQGLTINDCSVECVLAQPAMSRVHGAAKPSQRPPIRKPAEAWTMGAAHALRPVTNSFLVLGRVGRDAVLQYNEHSPRANQVITIEGQHIRQVGFDPGDPVCPCVSSGLRNVADVFFFFFFFPSVRANFSWLLPVGLTVPHVARRWLCWL